MAAVIEHIKEVKVGSVVQIVPEPKYRFKRDAFALATVVQLSSNGIWARFSGRDIDVFIPCGDYVYIGEAVFTK